MNKLTEKQKAFADYYIISLNATESYMKAYGTENYNVANTEGYRNLVKPSIDAYITERLKEIDKRRIMKVDEILTRLSEKARGNSYEEVVSVTQLGEVVKDKKQISEKDQLKALELLGKTHRLFTDKVQLEETKPLRILVKKASELNE